MDDITDVRAAFATLSPDRRKEILRSMQKALLKASIVTPVTPSARTPARSILNRAEGR
jgi:hypothetical protein